MILTKGVRYILKGTIESVKSVLPLEITVGNPSLFTQPFAHRSIGVLIGMTGGIKGRIIINSDEYVIGKLGEAMFGMIPEGEMLESFAGELANMIAGCLSTFISQNGFEMNITPPTVLADQTIISGSANALKLPITIRNVGELIIILIAELKN